MDLRIDLKTQRLTGIDFELRDPEVVELNADRPLAAEELEPLVTWLGAVCAPPPRSVSAPATDAPGGFSRFAIEGPSGMRWLTHDASGGGLPEAAAFQALTREQFAELAELWPRAKPR
jgi:hypothetical protein